ncbi:hypothetical protein QJQ45_018756, partial [Haematococcus lacustris]
EPQLLKFAQRLDSGENGGSQAMWTTALHEAICGRDAMPNIEQQQQLYVRYGNQPEASAGNWQAAASRVNRSFSSLRAHEPSALESVMMSVKEAPAEFAVPVKQDRRLSPSFKVEVNIHHQGPLALPFTLKACLITQQDMDNILLWAPEDPAAEDKANVSKHSQSLVLQKMTELKGNTTITHYFASNCGASSLAARSLSSPYPADTSAPPASSCNALSMPAVTYASALLTAATALPGCQLSSSQLLATGVDNTAGGGQQPQLGGLGTAGGWAGLQGQRQAALQLSGFLLPAMPAQLPSLMSPGSHFSIPGMHAAGMANAWAQGAMLCKEQPSGFGTPVAARSVTSHEFEFTQLELLKPTRMTKVYMVFSTIIMDQDCLYLVYTVPTIGICRAEQREKAAIKLGIPQQFLALSAGHLAPAPGRPHSRGVAGSSSSKAEKSRDKAASASQTAGTAGQAGQGKGGPASPSQSKQQGREEEQPQGKSQGSVPAQQEALAPNIDVGLRRGWGVQDQQERGSSVTGVGQGQGQGAEVQGALAEGLRKLGEVTQGEEDGEPGAAGHDAAASQGTRKREARQALAPDPLSDFDNMDHMLARVLPQLPPVHLHQAPSQPVSAHSPHDPQCHGDKARRTGTPTFPHPSAFDPCQSPHGDASMLAVYMDEEMRHGVGQGQGQGRDRCTRLMVRSWILDQYEATGLSRRLTHLDLQALLSHAGFPLNATSDHVVVSAAQWAEFRGQFQAVLNLVRQISPVWNLEDPCVISGFDMDRQGCEHALAAEPVGTFVCRFSLSQPGSLVLSCKVAPTSNADNLLHAIIKIEDLSERRLDSWIQSFPGATHVLDVYRQKRIDKRKVFSTSYTRLRALH